MKYLKREYWTQKWTGRVQRSADSQANNGLSIPSHVITDPRYQQIKTALPEPMHPLFDDYTKSLIYPKKQEK
jgi:hypothetical protein